jgi:hypothetical protein
MRSEAKYSPLVSVWFKSPKGGRWAHGRNCRLVFARENGLTGRPGDTYRLGTYRELSVGGTLAQPGGLFAYYPLGFNPNDRPDLPRCGAPATVE